MLQQDIAEKLEREHKRNKKELSALQHTNATLLRQREESRRVVLHLRSLINGQTHHMEHIIRSLERSDGSGDDLEASDSDEHHELDRAESGQATAGAKELTPEPRAWSRASTVDSTLSSEHVSPDVEKTFFNPLDGTVSGRASRLSIADVADRHLRDKTDAIADIIRNISEQCAAAVEGLQLAQDADEDEGITHGDSNKVEDHQHPGTISEDGGDSRAAHSEMGDGGLSEAGGEEGSGYLTPDGRDGTSIPPTPDLVDNRASTSMSGYTASTGQDRMSMQYGVHAGVGGPTKIVGHDEEVDGQSEASGQHEGNPAPVVSKKHGDDILRPATAKMVT